MTFAPKTARANLIWMLALSAAVVAVFWIADGPLSAAIVGGWLGVFIAVMHLGRKRSEAVKIMGGMGDERIRSLSTRALAFAGGIMAFALPATWLASVLADDENYAVAALSAVFATAFIGASIVLEQRG
jgi:hypothetical protein